METGMTVETETIAEQVDSQLETAANEVTAATAEAMAASEAAADAAKKAATAEADAIDAAMAASAAQNAAERLEDEVRMREADRVAEHMARLAALEEDNKQCKAMISEIQSSLAQLSMLTSQQRNPLPHSQQTESDVGDRQRTEPEEEPEAQPDEMEAPPKKTDHLPVLRRGRTPLRRV